MYNLLLNRTRGQRSTFATGIDSARRLARRYDARRTGAFASTRE